MENERFRRKRGVRRVPVVGADGVLVGLLALDDVVEWLAEQLTVLTRLVRTEVRNERRRFEGAAPDAGHSRSRLGT